MAPREKVKGPGVGCGGVEGNHFWVSVRLLHHSLVGGGTHFSAKVCWPSPFAGCAGPDPWHSGSDFLTPNVAQGAPLSKTQPCFPKLFKNSNALI